MSLVNRGRPAVGGNRPNTAAPVAAAPQRQQTAKGTKPSFILKFKDADGSIKIITGLFTSVSKNGLEYLSGKDRESGVTYYVMTNSKAQEE
jgi:hypothetical protein